VRARMRRITWLGAIFGTLVVLSVFWPQSPDVARAAPDTESLWSESNTISSTALALTNSGDANGSTNSTWADATGLWAKKLYWWEFVMADSTVGAGQINSVTLYLKHYQTGWADDNFLIQIYDGTNWLEVQSYTTTGSWPPTGDTTDSWDVKTLGINTWTKLNAAKVRIFGAISNPAEDTVQWFVDTVELRIDYTPQVISITLTDASPEGIHFGSLNPGSTNNPDENQSETTPSIVVKVEPETNVNVDLQISGTDFSGTFTVANAKYSLTYGGDKTSLTTGYATFASDVAPGGQQDLWHWLSVPGGTTAGDYESIFSYKAIETGG